MSAVDVDTIALDAELTVENELRARLASATADNKALMSRLKRSQRFILDLQRGLATAKPRTESRT